MNPPPIPDGGITTPGPVPEPALLRARGLTKRYGAGAGAADVLRGVDLDLGAGEFTALLGPSGSGKSTLLAILGTLLRPTAGTLLIAGRDVVGATEAELTAFRGTRLGFVFQFHHLLPDLSALENVVFPAAARAGRETGEARRRAAELLARVGLADRLRHRPGQLSGGQRQRVAIARALVNGPALVLADEPTGSLDRSAAGGVLDLLAEINAAEGVAFLLSTHDERVAARCSRHLFVADGWVDGAPAR